MTEAHIIERGTVELLPGEGEVKIVKRTRVRRGCEACGEPATKLHTYLNERDAPARSNPASSAYRKDDISWCSDHDLYVCDECNASDWEAPVPHGFKWCSTFKCGERFAHLFLEWTEKELIADIDDMGAADPVEEEVT